MSISYAVFCLKKKTSKSMMLLLVWLLFFFVLMIRWPPISTLFPYTTLFRSTSLLVGHGAIQYIQEAQIGSCVGGFRKTDLMALPTSFLMPTAPLVSMRAD